MSRSLLSWLAASLALAGSLAGTVNAQTMPYGKSGSDDASQGDTASTTRNGGAGQRERMKLSPYIEAMQVISADLAPGDDVLTWSSLAVGVDGHVASRRAEGTFSVRYERRFGWGKAETGDAITGLARGLVTVVPHTLTIEAGALATRTSVDGNGAALPGNIGSGGSTHLYSFYAGPNLSTHAGDVAINANYFAGYTELGGSNAIVANGIPSNVDVFDHSVTQSAMAHAGLRPGDVLPVGLGVGAGYYQEDVSNLDQQVKDFHVRADVTVPVSSSVALVGGIGYEDVRVSSRDVLRDANGLPVVGSDGRFVTDSNSPRQIAYDTSGFIWDAGVTWRPSRRTALEAHVGRRYGSTTYYGSFGWKASRRSSFNASVYDSIAGFGGQINRALVALPTDFEVIRNPATGDINGCVAALESGNCLTTALGGIRSAVFRARGVQASYALEVGRLGMGLAGGYDRRKFIAAPGTIIASANGRIEENAWLSAWLNGKLDRDSSFGTYVYFDWFQSDFAGSADGTAMGANASYSRSLGYHVSANAALSIQGIQRNQFEDIWNASAVLGVRYTFF